MAYRTAVGAPVAPPHAPRDAPAPPPTDEAPELTPAQAARAALRARTDAVIARGQARFAAMAGAGPAAMPVPRVRLSLAEDVLAIPYLSERSILSYLRQDEVLGLRGASRTCREAVAEHAWSDFDEEYPFDKSRIRGRLSSWRSCFPLARAANLHRNKSLAGPDFVHLRGVRKVNMWGCSQTTITDAAFAHVRGIHTLNMSGCNQDTITDAAFAYLQGIHTLNMSGCNQASITDAAFAHLASIHTLYMAGCNQANITDAMLVHLRGICVLHIEGCPQLTNSALALLSDRCAALRYYRYCLGGLEEYRSTLSSECRSL